MLGGGEISLILYVNLNCYCQYYVNLKYPIAYCLCNVVAGRCGIMFNVFLIFILFMKFVQQLNYFNDTHNYLFVFIYSRK